MDREVKLFRPRYYKVTGTFQGLYETLGYITVRGDADEHLLDCGCSKKYSKILHSFHKKRVPNSFTGTFFNRNRIQYESGALETDSSEIFYFLPSTTDTVEEINRHMGSVNLYPIDMPYNSFEVNENVNFDPSKLDYENPNKAKMTEAVVKALKKVVDISNSNLVKNADGLLSKRPVYNDIEWIRPQKKHLSENRYKMLISAK